MLGGGILRGGDPHFMECVTAGILSVAPKARIAAADGAARWSARHCSASTGWAHPDGAYANAYARRSTDERLAGDGRV